MTVHEDTRTPGVARRHEPLGFGAECVEDGVRFRLWAPAARQVDVVLEDEGVVVPMDALEGGWFQVTSGQARPGSLYRYRIDGGLHVPDPASRFQPRDVHGPSEVVDAHAFAWSDGGWRGRPWGEVVVYELHVGTFSPEGTFAGAMALLPRLATLGVTAIELMPLADFPGRANWGYDGVLPFAPDSRYGRPEDLKALIAAAHGLGLMVFVDVVYNHFGPDGNYLGVYAPEFFTSRHRTPWGDAINFDGPGSVTVRAYFTANARYWLHEYHCDGLRFDAVHAIVDDSPQSILTAIAEAVAPLRAHGRHIHLVLENENNEAGHLNGSDGPQGFTAQWNDDIHHVLHVLLTGERDGYYADYMDDPAGRLGRCLTEGFAYQGEWSAVREGVRGESTRGLSPTAFVGFLQNHDQIGNRAFGERITALASPAAVRAATAVLLLAPSPPLLFMGQEFACSRPFLFFCDFGPELASAVTEGRRREFARFPEFADESRRAHIPDPNDPATLIKSRLDWTEAERSPGRDWLTFHRELLATRARHIGARLAAGEVRTLGFNRFGARGLTVGWLFADGAQLHLAANLGDADAVVADRMSPAPMTLYETCAPAGGRLGPWEVRWGLWPGAADTTAGGP